MGGVGAWYTPPALVAALLDTALGAWGREGGPAPPTLLDPSCGEGAFLVAAAERLCRDHPRDRVAAGLHGVDIDAAALDRARERLVQVLGPHAADVRLVHADALLAPPSWGPFDLVLGNPPWVSAAAQTLRQPAWRAAVRARYGVARGNWDACCPFVERALAWTRPGGWHGFVVPNALASAPYGRRARALLARQSLVALWDWSDSTPFGGGAYPIGYLVQKAPGGGLPVDGEPWPLGEAVVAGAGHRRLAELAQVCGAATVAEAYALRPLLRECPAPGPGDLRVVNSGTLDPGCTLWGARPMRYLGGRWLHPVVAAEDLAALPPRRLAQARSPKVIVAGLTRRLEAFVDAEGACLAAKSTVVVLPRPGVSVARLGAVLNSPQATAWLRARHGGQALRGGYLRIGPGQLRDLPVPEGVGIEALPQGGRSDD